MTKNEIDLWEDKLRKAREIKQRGFALKDAKMVHERPIIGKVLILPISSAKEFKWDAPWSCISCTNEQNLNEENRVGFLKTSFADVEYAPSAEWIATFPYEQKNVFTREHAREILDFVGNIWNSSELLMIHCHAGISRSAAVGKAVQEIFDDPILSPFYDKIYMPNKLVYEIIMEEFSKNK